LPLILDGTLKVVKVNIGLVLELFGSKNFSDKKIMVILFIVIIVVFLIRGLDR
jgi:hypothetical protein